MNWQRTMWTGALCLCLLVQGIAAVAAAPGCTGHGPPASADSDVAIPVPHAGHHAAAMHADMNASAAHAAHTPSDHQRCDCGQDCASSCMLHAPGQFVPDDLFALPVPHPNALPLHADEHPVPTVVTPRLRPPAVS